ncbi:LysR family transcriptional regulator [Streptomyces sp. NPDC048349]|uniref:LysR family transcriptional regulator n=1 Tax=Streptomyces sp. NPDC048349 TaxID=3155486 RepID=UPI00343F9B4D
MAVLLERTEVQTFLALAEELHFGRVAEQLGLTTGRISQTIKKLERRIGAPLFERNSRQVSLTPLGRDLATDLAPLVHGMDEAVRRAMDRARGTTGLLRAGFLGAAAGQLLLKALELFAIRHPDCKVTIHENQIHEAMTRLHSGELDVLITAFPVSEAVAGPVLLSEARVLAVPARSLWAAHASVSVEVLAEQPVIQMPLDMPQELRHERTPTHTPAGRPVPCGPTAATFPEVLALVAAGKGVFPVGEHAQRFYPRPDVAYVTLNDAAPVQWGPVWLESNVSTRLRAFVQAAVDANV